MSSDNRDVTLEIACPICGQAHTYRLEKQSSVVMHHMSFGMDTSDKKISFEVVAPCPTKSEQFKVKLTVAESFNEIIESVSLQPLERNQDGK